MDLVWFVCVSSRECDGDFAVCGGGLGWVGALGLRWLVTGSFGLGWGVFVSWFIMFVFCFSWCCGGSCFCVFLGLFLWVLVICLRFLKGDIRSHLDFFKVVGILTCVLGTFSDMPVSLFRFLLWMMSVA